jgi:hypothetical protein
MRALARAGASVMKWLLRWIGWAAVGLAIVGMFALEKIRRKLKREDW